MTIPLLVFLGQAADGLGYQLAYGRGTELNPAVAGLDPAVLLILKVAAGVVLAFGIYALRNKRVGVWLAVAGFLGCATELVALA